MSETASRDSGKSMPVQSPRSGDGAPVTRASSQTTQKKMLRRLLSTSHLSVRLDNVEVDITRRDLVRHVKKRAGRDDSFLTLPSTIMQLMLFIGLVVQHLRVWQRQEQESALQEWVLDCSGNLTGPLLTEHVSDAAGFLTWLEQSGLGCIYGGRVYRPSGFPEVQIATKNVLLGDAELRQRMADGTEKSAWLLHSEMDGALIGSYNGSFLEAAGRATMKLRTADWLDNRTTLVKLSFSTYNERAATFGLTEVQLDLGSTAAKPPWVDVTAALIVPVPEAWTHALDVAYLALLLCRMVGELWEMWSSFRLGFGEFIDYWHIWNVVDMADVMLGFVVTVMLLSCYIEMQSNYLHSLLGEDQHSLKTNVMGLSIEELAKVQEGIVDIKNRFMALQMVFAANAIAIMAKFFKAFESNPRLKVVKDTLVESFHDIFHFLIVFVTIFFCFAMIGHVLFGSDLIEFDTTGAALNTGFFVLMGEFDWYVRIQRYPTSFLPSGMPLILVNLWFFIYMFFILLVLLNMLLAIILGRYNDVTQSHNSATTIWRQCRDYLVWKRETRGFVAFEQLRVLLENDYDPAHPQETVTQESLLAAFPKMRQVQAAFLIEWLRKQKRRQLAEETGGLRDAGSINQTNEAYVHGIFSHVRQLAQGLETSNEHLTELEAHLSALLDAPPPRHTRI